MPQLCGHRAFVLDAQVQQQDRAQASVQHSLVG